MKFCQTATLWISNCATSWNFKLRLPAKYYTNSHETNCSNSPINTAFRRGIIHICQLFHCKAYFDKPQTATLNYIFRLSFLVWVMSKSTLDDRIPCTASDELWHGKFDPGLDSSISSIQAWEILIGQYQEMCWKLGKQGKKVCKTTAFRCYQCFS